ncbi:hypothetical protein ACFLYQ_06295 [Chloroflexota bacterium]
MLFVDTAARFIGHHQTQHPFLISIQSRRIICYVNNVEQLLPAVYGYPDDTAVRLYFSFP